jgi:hypothetical protein
MLRSLIFVFLVSLAMCACRSPFYFSTRTVTPTLTDSGKVAIDLGLTLGVQLYAAIQVTPIRHALITSSVAGWPFVQRAEHNRQGEFEAGAGWYDAMDKKWWLCVLGGFGTGEHHTHTPYQLIGPDAQTTYESADYHSTYKRYWTQVSVYTVNNLARSGVAVRVSHIRTRIFDYARREYLKGFDVLVSFDTVSPGVYGTTMGDVTGYVDMRVRNSPVSLTASAQIPFTIDGVNLLVTPLVVSLGTALHF